jgi:hypothetical protein
MMVRRKHGEILRQCEELYLATAELAILLPATRNPSLALFSRQQQSA